MDEEDKQSKEDNSLWYYCTLIITGIIIDFSVFLIVVIAFSDTQVVVLLQKGAALLISIIITAGIVGLYIPRRWASKREYFPKADFLNFFGAGLVGALIGACLSLLIFYQ